jgi:hypothetical protein
MGCFSLHRRSLLLGLLLGSLMTAGLLWVGTKTPSHGEVVPPAPTPDTQTLTVEAPVHLQGRQRFLSVFALPDGLTFAGKPVALDNWQIRERIESEFYQILNDEGQAIILAKRTGRCFPPIQKQLQAAGLPDDLKYVILLESKCAIPTQHKPGKLMTRFRGAVVANWRDEKRDLELSAERTIKRLQELHAAFGDWPLAIAAYVGGREHLQDRMREQHVHDYWQVYDERDIMRFIPRVIAAKEIFSAPKKYLGLDEKDLYPPLPTEMKTIEVREKTKSLASIAEEFGSYYLELKLLNPDITTDWLPRGTHRIRVPRLGLPSPAAQ